jgi:drug/metabolite transporter (DMT)-like permease
MKFLRKNIVLILILASAFFAGNAPFAKLAVKEIPPFSLVFFRFLLAFFILIPLFYKQKIKASKGFFGLMVMCLLGSLNIFLFAFAIRLTTANIGQVLYVFTPIATSIFAYYLVKETFGFKKISGVIVGLVGALTIVLLPLISTSQFRGSLLGNILILLGVLSHSLYTVFSKRYQKKYTPFELTFAFVLVTGLVSFFFSLSDFIYYPNWFKHVSTVSIASIMYLGILGTAMNTLAYQYIIKHASPVAASTTLYLTPIASSIFAYFLLDERITFVLIIGGVLTMIGAWLTTSSK